MEQINFTRESLQARSDAIKLAGAVAGLPEDYYATHTVKGEPQQAEGIGGVLGASDNTGESIMNYSTHAEAVIAIADYIVTGARFWERTL